ncbi:hypothetical protein QOT17_005346 [Balamuthia mandrillaris]
MTDTTDLSEIRGEESSTFDDVSGSFFRRCVEDLQRIKKEQQQNKENGTTTAEAAGSEKKEPTKKKTTRKKRTSKGPSDEERKRKAQEEKERKMMEDGMAKEMWDIDFEDLEFGKMIGRGNFGKVYQGEYVGTPVAIKKLENDQLDEKLTQKYAERELNTLKNLHHPNVVQLIGLCKDKSDVYIITEWVSGGDLKSIIKNPAQQLTWRRKLQIAKDVATAMAFLHKKKLIHRDLKPANLLATEHGTIKVCDLGFSRTYDEKQKYMTIAGSATWMAPEVIMGDQYDSSADVYSYGCILISLLSRQKMPKRSPASRFGFKMEQVLGMMPPSCPLALSALMANCLNVEPSLRPTFRDVLVELKSLLEELPEELLDSEPSSSSTAVPATQKNSSSGGQQQPTAAAGKKKDEEKVAEEKGKQKGEKEEGVTGSELKKNRGLATLMAYLERDTEQEN